MGIYDRDYYRAPQQQFGAFDAWSMTTWLIVINVGVFVFDHLAARSFAGPLWAIGNFSVNAAVFHLQIWRFITFQFLHYDTGHIFGNMLGLYFFGSMVESMLGPRRYVAFYLLCGVAGAALFTLFSAMGILEESYRSRLIGASAGVFGVLIAAARTAPNTTVMLMFPPIPMRLRTMAWLMIGIALFTTLTSGPNAGGEAAHLGGAALGYFLIQNPRLLDFALLWPPLRRRKFPRIRKNWRDDWNR